MSKNRGSAGGSSTVTAKERRKSYGRRSTDLTEGDLNMLDLFENSIQECTVELANAYERMEQDQVEIDRLKAENRVMIDDTQKIIESLQAA